MRPAKGAFEKSLKDGALLNETHNAHDSDHHKRDGKLGGNARDHADPRSPAHLARLSHITVADHFTDKGADHREKENTDQAERNTDDRA